MNKNKHLPLIFILSIFVTAVLAQSPSARIIIDTKDAQHPWNHLNVNNSEKTFQFAIVTDRTGGHRPGVFPVAVDKLNLLQPEFVMSVGDLIEGYTEDEVRIDSEWEEFTGFISKLQMPFFYLPGNHDYINPVMAKKWKERFGKDYYHFVYKDVLFLCLNSEERMRGAGRGSIDQPQYDYIKKTLAENTDVKWTLVFLHQPLWDQKDPGMWPDVENLLKDRSHTVFAGHRHRYVKYDRNNSKYFILATTGGGSGLRGPRFGEFDHVVWITMTDNGPIMANLLLDGIWDENINTEEKYAISAPLMRKQPFSISPLLVNDEYFEQGKTTIKVQNDSDVPMKALIQATSNDKIWAALPDFNKTIAPNSTEIVELNLMSKELEAIENISPIRLMTKAIYQPEGQAELALSFNYLLKSEQIYTTTKAKQLKIDGKLDDWIGLNFEVNDLAIVESDPFSHRSADDCSFKFDTKYDDQYLYLAAEVIDDQLNLDQGKRAIDQDGIGFMLDARPLEVSASGRGGGTFSAITIIGLSPVNGGLVYRPNRIPKGTQWACKKSEKGYTAEVAIPVSYLNEKYGGEWKNFRLNVLVKDIDMDGAHKSQVSWQPAWSSKQNRLGSGIFEQK